MTLFVVLNYYKCPLFYKGSHYRARLSPHLESLSPHYIKNSPDGTFASVAFIHFYISLVSPICESLRIRVWQNSLQYHKRLTVILQC